MRMLSLESLLDRVPELSEHTVAPPALAAFRGIERLESDLNQICRAPGAPPRAFAALGNVLVREGRYVDAIEAYRNAADLDPSDAQAHWMCAEIAHVLADRETSALYRARALVQRRVFSDPLPVGSRTALLVLLRDVPYSDNTPIELLVDRRRVAVHKYYLEGEALPPLPPYDAVFCAFGYARDSGVAVARAAAFPGAINDASLLERTARERLPEVLSGIDGVTVAQTCAYDAARMEAVPLPALVRPLDTHAGEGLAYLFDAASLQQHLARHPAAAYYVSQFVDYASADGYFRKFRVIFVDGEPHPYHFAVSPQWMVHYQNAPMDREQRFRDEERAFLEEPAAIVPDWTRRMGAIAKSIGLAYFGIDATVLPDGTLFIFEADAAMLVHDEDARGVFAYKRPYVARIREAFHALIARRTLRRTP